MSAIHNNKRMRSSSNEGDDANPESGSISCGLDDVKPFSWTHKITRMDPANLLLYIPSLPEKTQYFDTGVLLGATLDPDAYSANFLTVWREIRLSKELLCSFHDNPPDSVNRPARMPPLSTPKAKLRAAVTYHRLLEKAVLCQQSNYSLGQLTFEIANKLLDYLVLCSLQHNQEEMHMHLPDHLEWFESADRIIRRHRNPSILTGGRTFSPSADPLTAAESTPSGHHASLNYEQLVENIMSKSDPNVDPLTEWGKIYGNREAKETLYTNMVLRLERGEPVDNVLLFGAPGTGKTMLLESAAALADWTLFHVTQDMILHTYQGQSEKVLAAIFNKARECQPACIIFDHVEHLFARRSDSQSDRQKSIACYLRAAMSRVMEDEDMQVICIATAIEPENIDDAFIRRFSRCVYVPLPDQGAILAVLREQLASYELHGDVTDQSLHNLATEMVNKRTLSAFDVTRAVGTELRDLLEESWRTAKHFREETLENGEQVIIPCSLGEPGAFRCTLICLGTEKMRRLRRRKVKMADIESVMRSTVVATTEATLRMFHDFNKAKGTRLR